MGQAFRPVSGDSLHDFGGANRAWGAGGTACCAPTKIKRGRAKARPYKAREKNEPGRVRGKTKSPGFHRGALFYDLSI